MSDIQIRGRIEVMPGNKLMVPGCEPVSALTSTSLDENRVCTTTVVDLADALAVIPGSTVEQTRNPRRKWFVLPSGPGPNPSMCDTPIPCRCKKVCCCEKSNSCQAVPDWYAALRSIGQKTKIVQEDKPIDPCSGSGFPLRGIF